MDHIPLIDPQPHHTYGTRIRQNSVLKPSARLRQSPDPAGNTRKPKHPRPHTTDSPLPSHYPLFPPPHVVLHPDDATSKVFLAIGRSFLSVGNRAMTIKDLAEMTVNFGLVCQNVSAASQAITTYIRTHMHRCEVQQDHPLLLRHVLSGTAADDDLLPALHSRAGGAHCTVSPENRATNFRRGTMVWYLSRATGAPCPFARAGIRLCDYAENGRVDLLHSPKEKKRQRDRERRAEQCGQKRKRPLRSCAAKDSEPESQNEEGQPPPKVKLTLRLKPLVPKSDSGPSSSCYGSGRIIDLSKDSDSDDSSEDYMSVDSSDDDDDDDDDAPSTQQQPEEEKPWSLPPYPRRSISIPCYTPSCEDPYPRFPSSTRVDLAKRYYRRSPSVPYSIGSPPPNSEDEDDDFHISMTGARRHSAGPSRHAPADPDFGWDADLDSEGDGETMWESPGPRSPSASFIHNPAGIAIKEEPRDVQDVLDAWDDFDSTLAGAKVVEVLAQVLEAESTNKVKLEAPDAWDWDSKYTVPNQDWYIPAEEPAAHIKQEEDFDLDSLLSSTPSQSDSRSPLSIAGLSPPISPASQFSLSSHSGSPSAQFPGFDEAIDLHEFDFEVQDGKQSATVRPRAKTVFSFFTGMTPSVPSTSSISQSPQRESTAASKALPELALPASPSGSQSLVSLIQSMSMNSPTFVSPSSLVLSPPCISPQEIRRDGFASSDVVVVHTCQPCTPAISATQIEGISVYQMTLGTFSLLRRIDTDFVNLSPIGAFSGAQCPALSTIPNATVITKGSPAVSGTWVPLAAAQAHVREHPVPGGVLDVFLSDVLFERFPSALQDFHRSSTPGRLLHQFGPHFGSTLQAAQLAAQTQEAGAGPAIGGMGMGLMGAWDSKLERTTALGEAGPLASGQDRDGECEGVVGDMELPLSPTEQEMFHALCVFPEWDKENPPSPRKGETAGAEALGEHQQATAGMGAAERPLRRSKRVADAIAAQSRTRARRGTSRNSLS